MMERNQNTFLRKVAKIDWEAAWRNFLSWEGFRKQQVYIFVEIHQVVYLRIQWFTVQYKFHLQKPPINKLHIMKRLGLKCTGVWCIRTPWTDGWRNNMTHRESKCKHTVTRCIQDNVNCRTYKSFSFRVFEN